MEVLSWVYECVFERRKKENTNLQLCQNLFLITQPVRCHHELLPNSLTHSLTYEWVGQKGVACLFFFLNPTTWLHRNLGENSASPNESGNSEPIVSSDSVVWIIFKFRYHSSIHSTHRTFLASNEHRSNRRVSALVTFPRTTLRISQNMSASSLCVLCLWVVSVFLEILFSSKWKKWIHAFFSAII